MAYNNQRKYQDESLDWIKKNIEIGPFLKDRGWQKDKQNSSQKEETLINPRTGEKISVPVNPLSNGDRVWSFKNDRTKGGTLIQLLKNEGWDWKEIRELAKGQFVSSAQLHSPIHEAPEQKSKSPEEARKLAQEKLDSIQPATGKDFLLSRGLEKATHISLRGLKVGSKEAGFGLYRNFTSEDEAELCSTIIYKPAIGGRRPKYFQENLDRGISILLESNQKLSEVSRIVVTESPVDALSYRQLELTGRLHSNKEEIIKSTAFLGTCGSLYEQGNKDLAVVFKMAAEKGQTIVLAMDNDPAGQKMASDLAIIAQDANCKYEIEIPTIGKDWNDQLISKEKNQINQTILKDEKRKEEKDEILISKEQDSHDWFFEEYGITEEEWENIQIARSELEDREKERVNQKNEEGLTLLHTAKSIREAKELLEKGADINAPDKYNNTPLHWSIFMEKNELAKFLIENGANVNAVGGRKRTPLHDAALKENAEITALLLENGAEVDAKDKDLYTALEIAKAKEYTKVVKAIQDHLEKVYNRENGIKVEEITSGPEIEKEKEEEKRSFFGRMVDRFKDIFNSEKNLREEYDSLKHPLHHAAQIGDVKKIEELATQGADLNVQITSDVSAREIDIAFLKATMDSDIKKAREIMENNKDLNLDVQDINKNTALHFLSIPVALKAVRGEAEEDKQAVTNTNLKVSSYEPSRETSPLIQADNPVKVLPKIEMTVGDFVPDFRLEIAEKVAFVQELLERMAEPNARNIEGKTPLHVAAMYGNTAAAKLFISYGASLNIQDAKGNTPAHYAAQNNHKETTSLLIEKGADLHLTNNQGREVIKMATGSNRDCSHNEVIGLVYQAMQAQKPTQGTGRSREAGRGM